MKAIVYHGPRDFRVEYTTTPRSVTWYTAFPSMVALETCPFDMDPRAYARSRPGMPQNVTSPGRG